MEAVTLMELVLPSLRLSKKEELSSSSLMKLDRKLENKDKNNGISTSDQEGFNKYVAHRHFHPGDLILRKIEATDKQVGKLESVWKRPFQVVCSHNNKAYKLETLEEKEVPRILHVVHLCNLSRKKGHEFLPTLLE
jgi:hypothetical protein